MMTGDNGRKLGARRVEKERSQAEMHAPARTNDVAREAGEKSPNSGAQLRETPAS